MTFEEWWEENKYYYQKSVGMYKEDARDIWNAAIESTKPKEKIPALLDRNFPYESTSLKDV